MSKESRFRRPFNKSHGKRVETLLKSEGQHLYHIYWSIRRILRFKKSLWVIYKILGLFVDPLTADDKYCLLNRGNLMQHFKMQLSRKGKIFSEFFSFFFFAFSKFRFNVEHFEKKMTHAAYVFFDLRTPKNVVR